MELDTQDIKFATELHIPLELWKEIKNDEDVQFA